MLTLMYHSRRFADPSKADNLVSLQDKLDVVKTVMKDNIQQILINVENLEKIEASATQLNKQSDDFRKNTKVLTNKM
jgi:Synaptobrevin